MKLISNRDRTTKIVAAILTFIFLLAIIASCTPEQKLRKSERQLRKLIKENPNLVKSDTTFEDKTVTMPGVRDSTSLSLNKDTAAVDSLTNHFAARVDSAVLDSINRGFKAILKKDQFKDTTIKSGKTKFHFSPKNGKINVEIETEPQDTTFKIPVAINTVEPVPETIQVKLKWHEKIALWLGKEILSCGIILLIMLAVYIIYRVVKSELF